MTEQKSLLKKNGEFTVNIAHIAKGKPTFGVVYAPAINTLYYGGLKYGSYILKDDALSKLSISSVTLDSKLCVVASRSHMDSSTEGFVERLSRQFKIELKNIGSSLKICLLASGEADIYPRFAPTMEWDTAAAHAVLNGAGGEIIDVTTGNELSYNKLEIVNPFFVASAGNGELKRIVGNTLL